MRKCTTITLAFLWLTVRVALSEPIATGTPGDPTSPFTPPTGTLTLRDALAATLLGNPELSAVALGVRVQEARIVQAGLLPNPELRGNVDNFGGTSANRAFNASESALRLAQLVELGGKRARRQALAGLERDSAQWNVEARRATVLADTAKAFVAVLALQERDALAAELVRWADASARAVDDQVRAGAGSPAEGLRARVAVSQNESERVTRDRELTAARIALASQWASSTPTFDRAAGQLDVIHPPPPLDVLLASIENNPDLARWTTELAVRDAAIALEEARAIPDVTVGAGPSYYADAGGAGWVLDLTVPLPLFNRNQGAIAAARAERMQADVTRRVVETTVRATLARDHEMARAAYERARRLRDETLPTAEAVYARTEEAYRTGALRALDALDAQRTLFALRDQYLDSLATYHETLVDLDRLAGLPADAERASAGRHP